MSSEIVAGSVVWLKSGGPAMTGRVVNFVMMTSTGLVRGWLSVELISETDADVE